MKIYKHYKGGLYELLHESVRFHEDGHPRYAVYRQIESGEIFIRPVNEFFGFVSIGDDGVEWSRFRLMWSDDR